MKITARSIAALAVLIGAAGCGSWVHRIDVQQGNVLDPDAVAKLKVGMEKDQVRFLLGSPSITDPFHENRWDYVYYLRPGRGEQKLQQLQVFFEQERVIRIEREAATD